MKKLMFVVLTLGAVLLSAAEFTVKPENAVIVVDLKGDAIPRLAAEELQYYVKMMTGKTMPVVDKAVPGKYAFIFKKPAKVAPKIFKFSCKQLFAVFNSLFSVFLFSHPHNFLPRLKVYHLTSVFNIHNKSYGNKVS